MSDHLEHLCRWALTDVPVAAQLTVSPVVPELGELSGNVRGAACVMHTRVFTGAEWRRWLVSVIRDGEGRAASLTVIGFPRTGQRPILGIDIIGFGGRLPLIAIDVLPIPSAGPELHQTCSAGLRGMRAELGALVVDRRRPDFAATGFSPDALITGCRPGNETEVLGSLADAIPALYFASTSPPAVIGDPTADHAACDEAVRHWLQAERQNRREHSALARIFGERAADRFLAELLLTENLPH